MFGWKTLYQTTVNVQQHNIRQMNQPLSRIFSESISIWMKEFDVGIYSFSTVPEKKSR
jgi:hypothetical protein